MDILSLTNRKLNSNATTSCCCGCICHYVDRQESCICSSAMYVPVRRMFMSGMMYANNFHGMCIILSTKMVSIIVSHCQPETPYINLLSKFRVFLVLYSYKLPLTRYSFIAHSFLMMNETAAGVHEEVLCHLLHHGRRKPVIFVGIQLCVGS